MKKAFTLAEVLITLAIIGIVAALTIPSVISNYQQQEFKTGLKKAVSVLNEAIQTNIAQEGETPYENSDLFTYLQRHMSVIKTGGYAVCKNSDNTIVKNLNQNGNYNNCMQGGDTGSMAFGNYVFYTADGMRFEHASGGNGSRNVLRLHESGLVLDYYNHRCGSYGLSSNSNNTLSAPCIIIVDVNGDKKPNPSGYFITDEIDSYHPVKGMHKTYANLDFEYTYPSPTDKKLQDIFTIMITDEKAIPFGVVAQRAMYSK